MCAGQIVLGSGITGRNRQNLSQQKTRPPSPPPPEDALDQKPVILQEGDRRKISRPRA